jgi:hypothetical protein
MRDYPILHGSKSTVENIQFYMDVNQHQNWIVSDVDLLPCKIG